ncbi:nickel/cobalt transporter [Euzebya pacifica]|uniref:nickel/cobalt transporter n=1 Tax=Euzebya pacifica TaxID=1608957 RepID=UPI000DF78230|nr:sulfite exporter TauE/SafE family protein [Euzebya pacifica]
MPIRPALHLPARRPPWAGAPARLPIAVVLVVVCLALLGGAGTADAHPLGPPPEATIAASGQGITVMWSAERDDIHAIARAVGAAADEMIFEEVNGELVQVAGDNDVALLAEDPAVAGYFLDHIRVERAGDRCDGVVTAHPTFDGDPAVVVFTCPQPAGEVRVTITALTELSDRYRTISRATHADPASGLHTATAPTVAYTFSPDDGTADDTGSTAGTTSGSVHDERAVPARVFGPLEDRMLAIIDTTSSSAWALLGGVMLALGIGALHALGPGHGKAVTASYVASTPTGRRDALMLGAAVAIMHTASALVLGFLLFAVTSATGWIDDAGRWLRVLSALMVLGVGLWLLRRRWPSRSTADPHMHDHAHAHNHGVGGDHVMSLRGLLLIGVSGGLLPSPSALLVLTTGLFTGRTAYAMVLVATFGVGMALTLTAIALGSREIRARANRATAGPLARLADAAPLVGAAVLVATGMILVVTSVAALELG